MRKAINRMTGELLGSLQRSVDVALARKKPSCGRDIFDMTQALVYLEALVSRAESEDRYAKLEEMVSTGTPLRTQKSESLAMALATLSPKKKPDGGPGNLGRN